MPHQAKRRLNLVVALVMAALLAPLSASAHFHTYWPQVEGCYGKPGEAVTWKYFWGHPYEMIIYDAQPAKFFVRTPDGKRDGAQVKESSIKDDATGQMRKSYEVSYTPAAPGDYYLCLEGPAYYIAEEQVFWQDYVKQPCHVMAAKGWDKPVGLEVELVPLTRPYGWPAGSVFKAQAFFKGKPLKNAAVEIEKFNGAHVPKDKLPKDRLGEDNEPLITRVLKTDNQGYLVCSLDSPGWWVISVSVEDGKKFQDGQPCPVEKRGCLWVYMEPAAR